MAKESHPALLSPREFWETYFKHAVTFASKHKIPRATRSLFILDQVFGGLVRNCTASIKENRIEIAFHGCGHSGDEHSPTCETHLGAISGIVERAVGKKFNITRDRVGTICRLVLESR